MSTPLAHLETPNPSCRSDSPWAHGGLMHMHAWVCLVGVNSRASHADPERSLPPAGSDVVPQVQPITVVKNEYKLQVLHQIAVNSIYICYGLKQGSIRALNKHTAARVLLKAHTSMVTDMRFFGAASNLLASCDQAGDVVVTRVSEEEVAGAGLHVHAQRL